MHFEMERHFSLPQKNQPPKFTLMKCSETADKLLTKGFETLAMLPSSG